MNKNKKKNEVVMVMEPMYCRVREEDDDDDENCFYFVEMIS